MTILFIVFGVLSITSLIARAIGEAIHVVAYIFLAAVFIPIILVCVALISAAAVVAVIAGIVYVAVFIFYLIFMLFSTDNTKKRLAAKYLKIIFASILVLTSMYYYGKSLNREDRLHAVDYREPIRSSHLNNSNYFTSDPNISNALYDSARYALSLQHAFRDRRDFSGIEEIWQGMLEKEEIASPWGGHVMIEAVDDGMSALVTFSFNKRETCEGIAPAELKNLLNSVPNLVDINCNGDHLAFKYAKISESEAE